MIHPEAPEQISIAQQIDPGMQLTQDIIAANGFEAPQDPRFTMTDRFREGFRDLRHVAVAGVLSFGALAINNDVSPVHASPVPENAGTGFTAVAANSITKIHATDVGGQSIVANLTETNAAVAGFITAYPCAEGLPNPLTSNINFNAGVNVANGVTVKADANGDVCLTPNVATDMVWDQAVETSAFTTHNAVRKLDTRLGLQGSQVVSGTGGYIGLSQLLFHCTLLPDAIRPQLPEQYMTVNVSGLTPDYTPDIKSDANGDGVGGSFLAEQSYMPVAMTGHIYTNPDGTQYTKGVDLSGNQMNDIRNTGYVSQNRFKGMLSLTKYNSVGSTSSVVGKSVIYVDEPCV